MINKVFGAMSSGRASVDTVPVITSLPEVNPLIFCENLSVLTDDFSLLVFSTHMIV
jgi:hypothetical protein